MLLLSLSLLSIIARPARAEPTETMIAALADPDPQARKQAETALSEQAQHDRTVRAALIDASRQSEPAVAAAAGRILLSLPWSIPADPPAVRQLLQLYGTVAEPGRIAIISRIAQEPRGVGRPALLRLILEDPSEDVCWNIVTQFRDVHDAAVFEQLRKMNPPENRPAALVLVGRAWNEQDHAKALDFYRRAIETESRQPTFDDGELDEAFDALANDAVLHGNYDEAAHTRRLQSARVGLTRDSYPRPIYELFLLHAQYGPLDGFTSDLATYVDYLSDPPVLYSIAKAYDRAGMPFEAMVYAAMAKSSAVSLESHLRAASFLSSVGWFDPARAEAYAALSAPPAQTQAIQLDDANPIIMRINVRRLLTSMASQDDNDAAAIEHLTATLDLVKKTPGVLVRNRNGLPGAFDDDFISAQLNWHRARIALANGQTPTKELDAIMAAAPVDSDVTLNTCPMLKQVGRLDDARALFEPAYKDAKQRAQSDANDATSLNDLAWLCARCNENLPEALDSAKRAVAMQPDNAAMIDTLAEVQFRMGNPAEAVRLETTALKLRPADEFMQRQLARFQAGVQAKAP